MSFRLTLLPFKGLLLHGLIRIHRILVQYRFEGVHFKVRWNLFLFVGRAVPELDLRHSGLYFWAQNSFQFFGLILLINIWELRPLVQTLGDLRHLCQFFHLLLFDLPVSWDPWTELILSHAQ